MRVPSLIMRSAMHFDLSHVEPNARLRLHVEGRAYEPVAHTAKSLAAARRSIPFLHLIPDHRISHVVSTFLPQDTAIPLRLTMQRNDPALQRTVWVGVHIPSSARKAFVREALKREDDCYTTIAPKLARVGIEPETYLPVELDDPPKYPRHICCWGNAYDAAAAIVFNAIGGWGADYENNAFAQARLMYGVVEPALRDEPNLALTIAFYKDAWVNDDDGTTGSELAMSNKSIDELPICRDVVRAAQLAIEKARSLLNGVDRRWVLYGEATTSFSQPYAVQGGTRAYGSIHNILQPTAFPAQIGV